MELILFTSSFPHGIQEQWKIEEIKSLQSKFSKITVIPFSSNAVTSRPPGLLSNVNFLAPFFNKSIFLKPKIFFQLISKRSFNYAISFIKQKAYLSKVRMITFITAIYSIEKMINSPFVISLQKREDKNNIVLYFYWAAGASFMVPFLKGFKKIVVRFHGFDLYEERSGGFIPYRYELLSKMTYGVFISKNGLKYLTSKYIGIEEKCKIFRLGVMPSGNAVRSNDGTLRMVSCSSVISLKRVSLILEAVKLLKFSVEWLHIGGGDLFEILKREATNVPAHVKVILVGEIHSSKVMGYYSNQPVDLFINVSTSEGVPVSIMEAFSASIPVLATDVGGTSEIVDENVGILMPASVGANAIAKCITKFYKLNDSQKEILSQNAKKRFEEMCNANKLNEIFAQFLSSL